MGYQLELFNERINLKGKRVMVSLSGGINSAAVLCYLTGEYPKEYLPGHLYLYYIHITEHSPGTLRFVRDLIKHAKKHFQVTFGFNRGSTIEFFLKQKFIPHPTISPCTENLKLTPIELFMIENGIELDLVGFISSEKRRIKRQQEKGIKGKIYPIYHFTEEDCIKLVKETLGWYPRIYDIEENGERVFKHNNCLPCKNFRGYLLKTGECTEDYKLLRRHFPVHFENARKLAEELNSYWGRSNPDAEANPCNYCEWENFSQISLFEK